MINLLAPEAKRQLRAARRNVVLRRYTVFVSFVVLLVFATFGGGYYLAVNERNRLQAEVDSQSSKTAKYQAARATATQFSKDLTTAKTIFANEVVFSDLLLDISKILPSGVVLSELNVSTETFGTEITLRARAKDANTGPINLKTALEQSDLFSNVKIANISDESDGVTASQKFIEKTYPVTIELLATIDANAGKRKVEGTN